MFSGKRLKGLKLCLFKILTLSLVAVMQSPFLMGPQSGLQHTGLNHIIFQQKNEVTGSVTRKIAECL